MKFKKCCLGKESPPTLPVNNTGSGDLNGIIQKGYDLMEAGDEAGAATLWLKAWDILKTKVPPGIKSVDDAEALFELDQLVFNWVQDVEMELANAAIDAPHFHDKRIGFCREFIQMFPGSVDLLKHMKLAVADSLFQAGKKAEAEQDYQRIVAEYPNYPWGYIHWGDFYAGDDNEKAEALYRKALGMDKSEDAVILERIRDLKDADQL